MRQKRAREGIVTTYGISNYEIFAHYVSLGWPWLRRARLYEFRWLRFELRILFDSFQCDLHTKSISLHRQERNLHTIDCSRLTNCRTYYTSISILQTSHEYNTTIDKICKLDQRAVQRYTNSTLTSVVTVIAKVRIKPARAASIVGVIIVTKDVKPTITADKRLKRMESHPLTAQVSKKRNN